VSVGVDVTIGTTVLVVVVSVVVGSAINWITRFDVSINSHNMLPYIQLHFTPTMYVLYTKTIQLKPKPTFKDKNSYEWVWSGVIWYVSCLEINWRYQRGKQRPLLAGQIIHTADYRTGDVPMLETIFVHAFNCVWFNFLFSLRKVKVIFFSNMFWFLY
jgi:hypothetical protein